MSLGNSPLLASNEACNVSCQLSLQETDPLVWQKTGIVHAPWGTALEHWQAHTLQLKTEAALSTGQHQAP